MSNTTFKRALLLTIISWVIIYFGISYISLEFNPLNYDKDTRFGFVLLFISAFVLSFPVSTLIELRD